MKKLLILMALFPSLVLAQAPKTIFASVTPAIETGAYATGDLVGGKLTFTAALPSNTGTGLVVSVMVTDEAAQAQDLELWLFHSNPSNTTFTENSAFDPSDDDLSKVLAVISLGSSTRFNASDNGIKYIGSLALPIKSGTTSAGTTLYGALVSRGSPTFGAADAVTVVLGIVGD